MTIGDETFVVPPLTLGQLRSGVLALLQQHDALIAESKIFEAMELRGQVILTALRRNYPDFPEDKLFNFLDMNNNGPIWLSILGVSGFTPGEEVAPTVTAAPRGNGTLSLSTAV
jgi:hypothetical protein